jgi:hypothetical protein
MARPRKGVNARPAKNPPSKNPGAFKAAEIEGRQVLELAKLGCTESEIAAVLGVSTDTLERRFAPEMLRGQELMKECLRRLQFRAAKRGNTIILIWLGKQLLGQKEPREYKLDVAIELEKKMRDTVAQIAKALTGTA